MTQASYDFAIIGDTPLAGLLAGLLSVTHKRRVCLIGSPNSAFRLARGIDLSMTPATRPETWALLKRTTPETLKLLARIGGRHSFARLDPIFVGETPAGIEALGHMRYVAMGFGFAVERLPEQQIPGGAVAYHLRDAVTIVRGELERALRAWLERAEVGRLAAHEAKIRLMRNGGVKIEAKGQSIEATQCVLADDAAILEHFDPETRERLFQLQPMTAVLTEPSRPLPAPVMIYTDRGVVLSQRANHGLVAIAAAPQEEALPRIGACLAGYGPLRLAGQTQFSSLRPFDGAPIVGSAKGGKALLVAGLGPVAAFLAPALARFFAGVAGDEERTYFAAREASRARLAVGEY
ncbi:MAG: hypothetical protein JWN11_1830, partial [Hyphomicrobiales bacterium]|nr:hypothetical protein [Hyphomicrobiales bacterium]